MGSGARGIGQPTRRQPRLDGGAESFRDLTGFDFFTILEYYESNVITRISIASFNLML